MRITNLGKPLTDAEIRQFAPSVMNDIAPADTLTEKYSFLPTITLINDMRNLGWFPYIAEQRQPHTEHRVQVTKHMVVFRNPSLPEFEGLTPEIILTNSHDGRNSFKFNSGLYHSVKQTSFVIYDPVLEGFKVKHQGYTIKEVQDVIDKVLLMIPKVYDKVRFMNSIQLKPHQKVVFALEAVKLRWKEGKEEVNIKELLKPIREDENSSTLWNVFQIVQEKIVNGGIKYELRNGRKQTARALVNIDQKIDVKKTLWKIAADLVVAHKKTTVRDAELV